MSKRFSGRCEGCGYYRNRVLASAFNPDESFRHLCDACDRKETARQPKLFKDKIAAVRYFEPEPEPVEIEIPQAQMGLFA
jgi:hypothetical protein